MDRDDQRKEVDGGVVRAGVEQVPPDEGKDDGASNVGKRRKLEAIEKWIMEISRSVEQEIEEEQQQEFEAWDDVKGGRLNVRDVKAARAEEVSYMTKRGIWKQRPIEECWRRTGKGPISVRWVDTDKGVDGLVDVRSRLVVRDFKTRCVRIRRTAYTHPRPLWKGFACCAARRPHQGEMGRCVKYFSWMREKLTSTPNVKRRFTSSSQRWLELVKEFVASYNFGCMA